MLSPHRDNRKSPPGTTHTAPEPPPLTEFHPRNQSVSVSCTESVSHTPLHEARSGLAAHLQLWRTASAPQKQKPAPRGLESPSTAVEHRNAPLFVWIDKVGLSSLHQTRSRRSGHRCRQWEIKDEQSQGAIATQDRRPRDPPKGKRSTLAASRLLACLMRRPSMGEPPGSGAALASDASRLTPTPREGSARPSDTRFQHGPQEGSSRIDDVIRVGVRVCVCVRVHVRVCVRVRVRVPMRVIRRV